MSIKKGATFAEVTPENTNLNAAIAYSQMLGWKVFPIHYKSKAPITQNGFYDATDNVEQIREWFTLYPNAGIGLPTGKVNNIVVLDVDPRNGGDVSFDRLIDEYGELPHTVECLTGGGGNHIYFNYSNEINKSKSDEYPGLDMQRTGQYVILPPSTHPDTDKKYHWEESSKPVITPIADMPEALINLFQKKTYSKVDRKPPEEYLRILNGVSDGNRNNSMMSLIGYLLAKKIDYRIAYELVHLWNERNDPPIEADKVTRAFNNMLRKEAAKKR